MTRLFAILILAAIPLAAGADAVLTGPNGLRVDLSADTLAAMPVQEVETAHASSRGEMRGQYRGVLLWDVLAAHTDLDADPKAALRHTILVTARDDHQVAFSVGEILPEFGARPILIGFELDGAPIPDGLRMVAPGDERGARYVKDVVSLDIR
ncbi:MAG: hypothetical protein Q4G14_08890 [Paracoccus sp. (in: a-proteobacteria)]|uniref:hypothetical protein n=1 Tax=Paracoccus sp. TaxID=267 RepID=UPI0026DFB9CE|nr:hypothetical protein [Paracoccus sp. (in: a-proteobacteria)]MDO5613340.1 hypothetical protein [Paracoccus sp. (in: a-proteobacteria)]